ncbi:type 1 fimbrial protein, partial [Enterobacter cloacae]|nr:type 1 fimbrial protein [Enterobacter cloacae]
MNKKLMMAMLAAGSVLTMTNALAAAGTVNFNGNI